MRLWTAARLMPERSERAIVLALPSETEAGIELSSHRSDVTSLIFVVDVLPFNNLEIEHFIKNRLLVD